jgi:hypothetical protein
MIYQLIADSNCIKRVDDAGVISFIPDDPENSDWRVYQEWLAADPANQPEPAE